MHVKSVSNVPSTSSKTYQTFCQNQVNPITCTFCMQTRALTNDNLSISDSIKLIKVLEDMDTPASFTPLLHIWLLVTFDVFVR